MDMWGVGCIALELLILKPLVKFDFQRPADVVKDIFKQCSLQDHDAITYYRRLPAWRDSLGSVPCLPTNALLPRVVAAQVPRLVAHFVCKELLVIHPLHRTKVGPARARLSSLTT